jgi:enoyl-CoA hydratase/carnithine racemase
VQYEKPAISWFLNNSDGIVTLTLNAPGERNALSSQIQWDAVVEACERVQRDASVKVVILTGAGSAFCAGGNVKDFRDKRGSGCGGRHGGAGELPVTVSSASRWLSTVSTCRRLPR